MYIYVLTFDIRYAREKSLFTGDKKMLERDLEHKFKKEVQKRLNAFVWKFVSPGIAGVPDRLVILPNGRCIFAELKKEGETLRPLQLYRRRQLQKMGMTVWVIDSNEKIREFINAYKV